MHVDQFNEEFAPFYADFRYYGSVQLPEYIRQETLAANMLTRPDDAIAITIEHLQVERFFVRLYWHTLQVGDFDCTQAQYDQEILPASIIEATQTYQVPAL